MKTFSQLLTEGGNLRDKKEMENFLSDLSDLTPGKGLHADRIDRILDKMEQIVKRSSDRQLKDTFALADKFDSDDSSSLNIRKYNDFLDELDNWLLGDD